MNSLIGNNRSQTQTDFHNNLIVFSNGKISDAPSNYIVRQCLNSEFDFNQQCNFGPTKPSFCEKCNNKDGCNGASQYYGSTAVAIVAIPMAIFKILSLL